jgi:hypothetical protein
MDVRGTFKRNERLELIAALDRLVRAYAGLRNGTTNGDTGPGSAYAHAVAVLQKARSYIE